MAAAQNLSKSPIQQQLLMLLDLQQLDNEITTLENEREEIPRRMENFEDILLEKRKILDEKERLVAQIESEISEKIRSLDLERIKLKNTRNKENAIQNIKQYEAFVKEVEIQEKTSEELEEELNVLRQRIKVLRKEQEDISASIQKMTEDHRAKETGLQTRLTELDKLLEKLYDKRDELAERLDEDVYLKYEYIAERKDGIAVAIVEHGHCLECNMAIPPQMFNELIRCNRLMVCPACNRILVYKDETPKANHEIPHQ